MESKNITHSNAILLSWRRKWNCWHTFDPTCKKIWSKLALLFHQEKATNLSDYLSCGSGSVLPELLLCILRTEHYRYRDKIWIFTNECFNTFPKQVNYFRDHVKIILCPLMGAVSVIDEEKNFRTFRLTSLAQYGCSIDLLQRLEYVHEKISFLLTSKSQMNAMRPKWFFPNQFGCLHMYMPEILFLSFKFSYSFLKIKLPWIV